MLNQVLTRVVGHYPKSNTLLIDCGWTGASAQGNFPWLTNEVVNWIMTVIGAGVGMALALLFKVV